MDASLPGLEAFQTVVGHSNSNPWGVILTVGLGMAVLMVVSAIALFRWAVKMMLETFKGSIERMEARHTEDFARLIETVREGFAGCRDRSLIQSASRRSTNSRGRPSPSSQASP